MLAEKKEMKITHTMAEKGQNKILTIKEIKRILRRELGGNGFDTEEFRKDTMSKMVKIEIKKNKIGLMIRYENSEDGWFYFEHDRNKFGLKSIIEAAKKEFL